MNDGNEMVNARLARLGPAVRLNRLFRDGITRLAGAPRAALDRRAYFWALVLTLPVVALSGAIGLGVGVFVTVAIAAATWPAFLLYAPVGAYLSVTRFDVLAKSSPFLGFLSMWCACAIPATWVTVIVSELRFLDERKIAILVGVHVLVAAIAALFFLAFYQHFARRRGPLPDWSLLLRKETDHA